MPSAIEQTITKWYTDLDRLESSAFRSLERAYEDTLASIDKQLSRFAANPGRDASVAYQRLLSVQKQVQASYAAFGQALTSAVANTNIGAAISSAARGIALLEATFAGSPFLGTFHRINPATLRTIAGFLADGSPLARVGAAFGREGAIAFRRILTTGIATGRGPLAIARDLRASVGGARSRAETIVRTEMMRVSREVKRQTWTRNADVLKGWRWSAALDRRSCPVCWAMHNTIHALDKPMRSHPRCRCAMIPVPKTLAELGIMAREPALPRRFQRSGSEMFASLPQASQRAILGPAAFRAYNDGAIQLNDLVAQTSSPVWGDGLTTASLKSILGTRANRYYRR